MTDYIPSGDTQGDYITGSCGNIDLLVYQYLPTTALAQILSVNKSVCELLSALLPSLFLLRMADFFQIEPESNNEYQASFEYQVSLKRKKIRASLKLKKIRKQFKKWGPAKISGAFFDALQAEEKTKLYLAYILLAPMHKIDLTRLDEAIEAARAYGWFENKNLYYSVTMTRLAKLISMGKKYNKKKLLDRPEESGQPPMSFIWNFANLSGVNYEDSGLWSCPSASAHAEWNSVDYSGSILKNINFDRGRVYPNVYAADFSDAVLYKCAFLQSQWGETDISRAVLIACSFFDYEGGGYKHGVNFSHAIFYNCTLQGKWHDANFGGTIFYNCELNVERRDVNFDDAVFYNCALNMLWRDVNFDGAVFYNCEFRCESASIAYSDDESSDDESLESRLSKVSTLHNCSFPINPSLINKMTPDIDFFKQVLKQKNRSSTLFRSWFFGYLKLKKKVVQSNSAQDKQANISSADDEIKVLASTSRSDDDTDQRVNALPKSEPKPKPKKSSNVSSYKTQTIALLEKKCGKCRRGSEQKKALSKIIEQLKKAKSITDVDTVMDEVMNKPGGINHHRNLLARNFQFFRPKQTKTKEKLLSLREKFSSKPMK